MSIKIKPKYKHNDKVYYLNSKNKISEEIIMGCVNFDGSYDSIRNNLYINYYYSLSGWISGTKFCQSNLFKTLEDAQSELLKRSRI